MQRLTALLAAIVLALLPRLSLAQAQPASQAPAIERLAWLAGTWTENRDGNITQETWLGPRGPLMVAANLATFAGRSSFEFLRIVEGVEGLALLASPGGRPPVTFRLKELGERRVVFENLAHDFPQRVLYAIEPDGALRARIEGVAGGRERAVEWRFVKAAP